MQSQTTTSETALSALMIAPDRALATQFSRAMENLGAFEVLLDIKSYPSEQTLDIRVRQLRPEVVFVDVASDLDQSIAIIARIALMDPQVTAVALDSRSDSDTHLRLLRAGESAFL